MSDSEHSDVTWEEFFGTSTDLMPTLLGMYDALFDTNKNISSEVHQKITHQHQNQHQVKPVVNVSVKKSNHFQNLSPTVQKMLANISDPNENIDDSEDIKALSPRKGNSNRSSKYFEEKKCTYSANRSQKISQYSDQRNSLLLNHHMNKSSECLATICDNATSNVQKMLSNIPDQDLVISTCTESVKKLNNTNEVLNDNKCNYSQSFTYKRSNPEVNKLQRGNSEVNGSFLYKISNRNISESNNMCEIEITSVSDSVNVTNSDHDVKVSAKQKITPLSPKMAIKRSNYLQVSNATSGTGQCGQSNGNGQQNEKEVSRPVSLSSLGSCSSSGSSGPNQPSSMYLASTESLDSDPEPTGSQGSADSGIAENPVMSPEQRVLQEILDTENVYVTDLKQVVKGYLQIWRSTPDCSLIDHLSDLFSNIEEIYEFNRKFLDELYESGNDLTFVANAFIQNEVGFRVYTEYCTHYPRIMAVLTELTQDVHKAQLIRERQVALGHALPLGSYLLKPVQRILKYHLLLHRLSKLCEPSQQESIDLALTTMTSIAGHINHMKGKHEHAVRVQEIQSQLYGWTGADLTAMGELCAEGTFRVGGARGYRRVFLFDKVLLITKNKSEGVLAYKSHIMCSNLMLVESVRGEPLSFHVIPFDNPRLQVTLRAKSLEHKREWTLQLKRVILENYNAVIPSHARQLVMQLGQEVNIGDDISTVDKWTPLKQYSAPEYLERRCRVRKSRDHSDRRAASHDRAFASLAAWRRKSEPNVAHYNTKTLPKKISKLKKAKDKGAKFYTDLSDSETCDVISESSDSLVEQKIPEVENTETALASNTLEQVVSQLLMQNQEFQKILSRQRKMIKDESSGVWMKQNICDKPKSDSLPRSFQLNEESPTKEERVEHEQKPNVLEKLDESELVDTSTEVADEDDEDMYPDHKIYRKSTIRFSLVQRFRAMISEESQRVSKFPTYKQGSELMGAKIAQPDYVDPQKLFSASSSVNGSQFSLDTISSKNGSDSYYEEIRPCDKITEEKNQKNSTADQIDTGQQKICSPILKRLSCDKKYVNSSQNNYVQRSTRTTELWANKIFMKNSSNHAEEGKLSSNDTSRIPAYSDSYYEKLLEEDLHNDENSPYKTLKSFTESKVTTVKEKNHVETLKNNRNIIESHHYKINECVNRNEHSSSSEKVVECDESSQNVSRNSSFSEQPPAIPAKPYSHGSKMIKRPMKPPPPVPAKPVRFSNPTPPGNLNLPLNTNGPNTKGWVKTVVGRFE